MSYADQVFIQNCKDILENGVWDTDREVRPRWEDDGAPAHTVKKFGIVNRYDLSKEFPLLTLRRTYWKTAVDELLWIWQQKSNNIHDLRGHIWDQWADENGSIGKAYGYQLGVKHQYAEGMFDQVDRGHHCPFWRAHSWAQRDMPVMRTKNFMCQESNSFILPTFPSAHVLLSTKEKNEWKGKTRNDNSML